MATRRERQHAFTALLRLPAHQLPVGAVASHQFDMRAGLDYAPAVEHEDAVGVDHAGQPVREYERGAPSHQTVERILNDRLVLGIDRRQRLVENEDRRVA